MINADTEASFGPKQALCFEHNLAHKVSPGGSIVVWFTEWARNGSVNDFRNWIELQPEIIALREAIGQLIVGENYEEQSRDSLTLAMAMFITACHQFQFEECRMISYSDTVPMLAFRVSDVRPRTGDPITPFSTLYARYCQNSRPPITLDDQQAIAMIEEKSRGTHTVTRENAKWVLWSPTGNAILESRSLSDISRLYRD